MPVYHAYNSHSFKADEQIVYSTSRSGRFLKPSRKRSSQCESCTFGGTTAVLTPLEGGDSSKIAQPGQHVDLKGDFQDIWSWTNDVKAMDMNVYFDPKKPNLAEAFDLDGLRPIIRDREGTTYLLTDNNGRFYICDPVGDGRMFAYKDTKLTMKDAIDDVLNGINRNLLVQQFNKKLARQAG